MYYFQIFWQNLSKATKTSKKDHSFYYTVSLKKPLSFYEPQLTQHYKKNTSATQPKICFWLVSEKTLALHHLQTPNSWSTWKAQVCIFLSICSRNVGSFYLVGGLNNFHQTNRCLGLIKCFKFLDLQLLFSILILPYFHQYFHTSISSIKTLKFFKQFGLKVQNLAKFL